MRQSLRPPKARWVTTSDADIEAFHRVGSEQVRNLPDQMETLIIPAGSRNSAVSILYGLRRYPPKNLKKIIFMHINKNLAQHEKEMWERLKACGMKALPYQVETYDVFGAAVLLGFILLISIFSKASSCGSPSPPVNSRTASTNDRSNAQSPPTPSQIAEETYAAAKAESDLTAAAPKWYYSESPDNMGRGTIKSAAVYSLNEVQFGFPYSGPQRGTLTLRVHPKFGRDVMLSIERGQFLCSSIDGCNISVRFDQGKPQTYGVSEPFDYSSTTIFLHNYDRFLASLRKSKKLQIEANFYQEGFRVFEFDTTGFKW